MKNLSFSTLLLAMLFLGTVSAEAANQYVRAGAAGMNNGTDWTNAYTSLPSTLVRGDTYYIADGTYGSRTLSTPASAALLITIKKATSTDHASSPHISRSHAKSVSSRRDKQLMTYDPVLAERKSLGEAIPILARVELDREI